MGQPALDLRRYITKKKRTALALARLLSISTAQAACSKDALVGAQIRHHPDGANSVYLIDVTASTVGTISVLSVFRHLGYAPDSHQFRMVDGSCGTFIR